MGLILLIVLVIALLGGGSWGYTRGGWGGSPYGLYGGGGVGLIVFILIVLFLLGRF